MNLTIEKLVYGGDGLARLPADERGSGKAVFVPFVLAGEHVEAALIEQKPGFARAQAERILQPSSERIEARCQYFQRCGGCHYQHTGYEQQLTIKAGILKENLRRIAKLELEKEPFVHPSPPWNYRNRSRFKIQTAPEFALGYFRFNSHALLPVEECPISSPLINRAIAALWAWGRGRAEKVAGELQEVELFADAEDSRLLIEAHCAAEISEASARQLAERIQASVPQVAGVVVLRRLAANPSKQRGGEPEKIWVAGAAEIDYRTLQASYRVSAGAFFQVNRHLVDELANLVTSESSGGVALDLYAGAGLFSSILARSFAQVIAVEASQISHADLVHNSPTNVKAVRATSEQYVQRAAGRLRADLVVVDPPRSGLGANVTRALVESKVARVTYVSCDPATLARDLGHLLGAGYRVEQAHLVDLFPQTYHLESVFQLVR